VQITPINQSEILASSTFYVTREFEVWQETRWQGITLDRLISACACLLSTADQNQRHRRTKGYECCRYDLMSTTLLNSRDLDFLLYELLDTEALLNRPRYQDHSIEVFNATLDTAHTISQRYFANHNAKGDANEPHFDGKDIHMIPEPSVALIP
jgi:hypothetical protein